MTSVAESLIVKCLDRNMILDTCQTARSEGATKVVNIIIKLQNSLISLYTRLYSAMVYGIIH